MKTKILKALKNDSDYKNVDFNGASENNLIDCLIQCLIEPTDRVARNYIYNDNGDITKKVRNKVKKIISLNDDLSYENIISPVIRELMQEEEDNGIITII